MITVNPASGFLPNGTVGVAYSEAITISGGSAPYSYVILSGVLPSGLSFDQPEGNITSPLTISGTPTAVEDMIIELLFQGNGVDDEVRTYRIQVGCFTIAPQPLPDATVNVPYSEDIVASGGTAPYIFSNVRYLSPNFAGVPYQTLLNGLSATYIAPDTLRISGTPLSWQKQVSSQDTQNTNLSIWNRDVMGTEKFTFATSIIKPCSTYPTVPLFQANGIYRNQLQVAIKRIDADVPSSSVLIILAGDYTGQGLTTGLAECRIWSNYASQAVEFTVLAGAGYSLGETVSNGVGGSGTVIAINSPTNITVNFTSDYFSEGNTITGGTSGTIAVISGVVNSYSTDNGASMTIGTVTYDSINDETIVQWPVDYGTQSDANPTLNGYFWWHYNGLSAGSVPLPLFGVGDDESYVQALLNSSLRPEWASHVNFRVYRSVNSQTIEFTPTAGVFVLGEYISNGVGAFGKITSLSAGLMVVELTTPIINVVFFNIGDTITGATSGATGTIDNAFDDGRPLWVEPVIVMEGIGDEMWCDPVGVAQFLVFNGFSQRFSSSSSLALMSQFNMDVSDNGGCSFSYVQGINIAPICTDILIEPTTLPNGFIFVPYSQNIIASGGTPPYTYIVKSGAIPTGMTLNDSTGVLSGTPTTAGVFNFEIQAIDSNNCGCTCKPYTITIIAQVEIYPFVGDDICGNSNAIIGNASGTCFCLYIAGRNRWGLLVCEPEPPQP